MNKLVSVIITSYNAKPFIFRCVRSILDQSYKNIECIVIDDGSIDNTASILEKVSDPRLKLFRSDRIGRGKALNLGVECAKGRYIAIQDADDYSHPDRLSVQTHLLDENEGVAAVGTDEVMIPYGGKEAVEIRSSSEPLTKGELRDVSSWLIYMNPIAHTSLMIRKSILDEVGRYDASRKNLYDWDLYLRLYTAGYKLYKYSVPLVFGTTHGGQFFRKRKRLGYILSGIQLQSEAMALFPRARLNSLILPALLFYRLLPEWLRMSLRKRIVSRLDNV